MSEVFEKMTIDEQTQKIMLERIRRAGMTSPVDVLGSIFPYLALSGVAPEMMAYLACPVISDKNQEHVDNDSQIFMSFVSRFIGVIKHHNRGLKEPSRAGVESFDFCTDADVRGWIDLYVPIDRLSPHEVSAYIRDGIKYGLIHYLMTSTSALFVESNDISNSKGKRKQNCRQIHAAMSQLGPTNRKQLSKADLDLLHNIEEKVRKEYREIVEFSAPIWEEIARQFRSDGIETMFDKKTADTIARK